MDVNVSNSTRPNFEPPSPVWQDYAQIGFLISTVLIGVPLNIISLVRNVSCSTWIARRQWRPHPASSLSSPSSSSSFGLPRLKAHLACTNLLVLAFYSFGRAVWLCTYRWLAGDAACKFGRFLHAWAICSCSNMMAVLAVCRWCAVRRVAAPARRQMPGGVAVPPLCAYALAALTSAPQLLAWRVVRPFERRPDWAQCVTVWTAVRIDLRHAENATAAAIILRNSNTVEFVYSMAYVLISFYVPFLIIFCMYLMIWLKLHGIIRELGRRDAIVPPASSYFVDDNEATTKNVAAENFELLQNRQSSKCLIVVTNTERNAIATDRRSKNGATTIPSARSIATINDDNDVSCATSATNHRNQRSKTINPSLLTLERARKTTLRKSAYILLAYVFCWFPYYFVALLDSAVPLHLDSAVQTILYDLIVVNAVVNPLVYGL